MQVEPLLWSGLLYPCPAAARIWLAKAAGEDVGMHLAAAHLAQEMLWCADGSGASCSVFSGVQSAMCGICPLQLDAIALHSTDC